MPCWALLRDPKKALFVAVVYMFFVIDAGDTNCAGGFIGPVGGGAGNETGIIGFSGLLCVDDEDVRRGIVGLGSSTDLPVLAPEKVDLRQTQSFTNKFASSAPVLRLSLE